MSVHLMSVHLMSVHLVGEYLTGVHLMSMYLMGVQLIGVYLMGVHLIDVYFMNVYMFPNLKRLWGKPPDPPPYKWWSICALRDKKVPVGHRTQVAHSLPQATHLLLKHCAVTFFQSFL
jgi:hypothetical protein